MLFGPEKSVVKLKTACFESLVFQHVSNKKKKNKRIAKFDGLEPRGFEQITGSEAPEIGPNSILNDSFFLSYRSSDNCGW